MRIRLASALALALLLVGFGLVAVAGGKNHRPPRLAPPMPEKPRPAGPLAKLDSPLLELRAAKIRGADVGALARRGNVKAEGDRVLVDVRVSGSARGAVSSLRDLGMEVVATADDPYAVVEGYLPIGSARATAALDVVEGVDSVSPGGVDTGSVLSEGDAAHRGPQARALGPTGAGVTMGVISDSINQVDESAAPGTQALSDSQANGDLPADVQVLLDDPGASDEGRAMAEIIYDHAPGIPRFLFSSGTSDGPVEKSQSIDNLVAAGANIIADDIFYLDEPFFQDGVIAQAVDRARAAGVAYFASAGNRARQSYESVFRPSSGDFHNFSVAGTDQIQSHVTVPDDRFILIELQWDEAVGNVQTDLDLVLYDLTVPGTPVVLDPDLTNNVVNGRPRARVFFSNTTGGAVPVGIAIQNATGTGTPFMKTIVQDNITGTNPITQHATNSDTINPDAASANGALTTAAINWGEAGLDDPEGFSSRGPKTRLFDSAGNRLAQADVRPKPNIAAADGVSTSVTGFSTFFGTSAATPSAAGIGALILSAQPTPAAEPNIADDVYAILQDPANSIDCTAPGRPDSNCGQGFVLADGAIQQALDQTPPTIFPVLNPLPNGDNDFYVRRDATVGFSVGDVESPITSRSGCDSVAITSETPGTTLTCTARSAGGVASSSLTVKRDDTAPALGRASLTNRAFRVAPRGRVAQRRRRGRAKRGTAFRFRLSEQARVRIRIQRRLEGRRAGGRCRKPTRRNRRRKRCTRRSTQRTFFVDGRSGAQRVAFSGRIRRGGRVRKLTPGSYQALLQATDPAGLRSGTRRLRFRVVR